MPCLASEPLSLWVSFELTVFSLHLSVCPALLILSL